jgi:hypothetical protein
MPAICFQGISGWRDLMRSGRFFTRLPDDFELSQRRILAHAIAEESLAIAAAVVGDVVQRVFECVGGRRGRLSQRRGFGEDSLMQVRTQAGVS